MNNKQELLHRAIQHYKTMVIADINIDDDLAKYRRVALEALKSELEREESDGCEYCNTENKFTETGVSIISKPYLQVYIAKQPIDNRYYLTTSEYEELKSRKGQYDNSPFRSDKREIYYCPKCGRKL